MKTLTFHFVQQMLFMGFSLTFVSNCYLILCFENCYSVYICEGARGKGTYSTKLHFREIYGQTQYTN